MFKSATKAAAAATPLLAVFTPCDGCGPTVRAVEVWILLECRCHQLRCVLTFCAHCSRLQTPALSRRGWSTLESERLTR